MTSRSLGSRRCAGVGPPRVNDSADLFTEVLLSHRTLRFQAVRSWLPTQALTERLPLPILYNPSAQDVNVSFDIPGLGYKKQHRIVDSTRRRGARCRPF